MRTGPPHFALLPSAHCPTTAYHYLYLVTPCPLPRAPALPRTTFTAARTTHRTYHYPHTTLPRAAPDYLPVRAFRTPAAPHTPARSRDTHRLRSSVPLPATSAPLLPHRLTAPRACARLRARMPFACRTTRDAVLRGTCDFTRVYAYQHSWFAWLHERRAALRLRTAAHRWRTSTAALDASFF